MPSSDGRRTLAEQVAAATLDPDIVKAIVWCRIGLVRPGREAAFAEAKALGLLAQDDVWRATEKGEGVLVALGLLPGAPVPRRILVTILWARNDRFLPHFVAAWPEVIDEMAPEMAREMRSHAEREFLGRSDATGWRFWTATEWLNCPDDAPQPEPSDA